jgi:DNA-binding protein HU-beta
MDISSIITEIDSQIAKLEAARLSILSINESSPVASAPLAKKRGRPVGSTNTVKPATGPAKRVLSDAGRAAIAAAQQKRWAAKNRAAKKAGKAETPEKVVVPGKSAAPAKTATAKKAVRPLAPAKTVTAKTVAKATKAVTAKKATKPQTVTV